MKKSIKLVSLVTLVLIILTLCFRPHRISGDCMESAIVDGKLYFVNKLSPYLRNPKVGDIVVFNHEGKDWISRIIATGKDRVQIKEGSVLVNDVVKEDSNVKRNWSNWNFGTYAIDESLKVPKEHVFVLSDNLDSKHDDSRVFGPVHNSRIVGYVW